MACTLARTPQTGCLSCPCRSGMDRRPLCDPTRSCTACLTALVYNGPHASEGNPRVPFVYSQSEKLLLGSDVGWLTYGNAPNEWVVLATLEECYREIHAGQEKLE